VGGLTTRAPSRSLERAVRWVCLFAALLPLMMLGVLLVDVVGKGIARIDLQFLTGFPSRHPEQAGIVAGAVGSIYLVGLTAALAVPIGVGAALYLEEYAKRGRLARLIETNISNLAGVPSIIYGLLGLELFVRALDMGRSLIAGAMTLALLVLPIVIMTTREALRSVPQALREAGFALGATKWQVVRSVVLPMSMPGILTGSILAISRAIGEAAPLVVLGALMYVDFLPYGPDSPFLALPIQIFNWTRRPQDGFAVDAAAAIIVLMLTLLVLNATAIIVRERMHSRLAR
jgi:phosphate transport system permease protein